MRTSVSSWPSLDDVLDQVVGQRARRHDTLLGVGDGGRLRRPDPDRQVALAVPLAQQDDRLVGGHLDADAQDIDLSHSSTVPPAVVERRARTQRCSASADAARRAGRCRQRRSRPRGSVRRAAARASGCEHLLARGRSRGRRRCGRAAGGAARGRTPRARAAARAMASAGSPKWPAGVGLRAVRRCRAREVVCGRCRSPRAARRPVSRSVRTRG